MKCPTKPEDDPEEGEILSDDFEAISDDSLTITTTHGKSVSNIDHLPDLSLSSVSDFDETTEKTLLDEKHPVSRAESPVRVETERRHKKRKRYNERQCKRKKRSKRSSDSDSSDVDSLINRTLRRQLKVAVCVNTPDAHKNSLKSRLYAMIEKSCSGSESDRAEKVREKCNISPVAIIDLVEPDSSCMEVVASGSEKNAENNETIPDNAMNTSVQTKNEDFDNELIQLRIEALKTAISNKYANRKKRKQNDPSDVSLDDTNKENANKNCEHKVTISKKDKEDASVVSPQTSRESEKVPTSPDEDEDVLRALLLASMSNNMPKFQPDVLESNSAITLAKKPVENKNKTSLNNRKASSFKINNNLNVKRVLNNGNKLVNKAAGHTNVVNIPPVKPLIINVSNTDSESDMELSSSPEKSPKKVQKDSNPAASKKVENNLESVRENTNIDKKVSSNVNSLANVIESTVEKFLKEQRAKVENELKKGNNLANLDIEQIKPAVSMNASKIVKTSKNQATSKKMKSEKVSELEKSALKFLPESKQEEYKQLKNMLKRAQMKPRTRRISQKLNDNSNNLKITITDQNNKKVKGESQELGDNVDGFKGSPPTKSNIPTITQTIKNPVNNEIKQNNDKLVSKVELPKSKQNTTCKCNENKLIHSIYTQTDIDHRLEELRKQDLEERKKEEEKKQNHGLLSSTLKQLRDKKNGRLQIHENYASLRPLVKKLNQVNKELKSNDLEVERLTSELNKAKSKQNESHRKLTSAIQELVDSKKKIDSRLKQLQPASLVTSTPIKQSFTNIPYMYSPFTPFMSNWNGSSASNMMINTWEQSTFYNYRAEPEANVLDPNDIDNIIKKTEAQVAVLEKTETSECRILNKVRYVSPLYIGQRNKVLNPFEIMCPFEVNGTCKDPDCTYNHLPK